VSPLLNDVDDEAEALIQDLLATLETLRTGDVEDATETLRRCWTPVRPGDSDGRLR